LGKGPGDGVLPQEFIRFQFNQHHQMKLDVVKIKLHPTYTFYIFVRKKSMDTKLTIRLNENVIERAKIFAQSNNISLSKLIESYLDLLTGKRSETTGITPLVKSLTGVIELPENYDYRKEYTDYLNKKYK
jgi:hypothetical protein